MSGQTGFPLAFRLAMREMRGGLSGFYIFLACIALGTAAIAGVNSVSRAITASIAAQGQVLLAGDVRFELNNREATLEERRYLDGLGAVSVISGTRSMARLPDGSDQTLVEVKGVDDAYPLYGRFEAAGGADLATLIAEKGTAHGGVAAPIMLERLGLKVGDSVKLGSADIVITDTIRSEPDAASDGFAFAPKLIVSRAALLASGLVQTGSLVEHQYKVKLANPAADLPGLTERARTAFPQAGWSIRSSSNATPQLTENIERFAQFLTLVGLSALIVGGVGVANAVSAFLDEKRNAIATFKCLGAPASIIFQIYLIQIMLIALLGIALGLLIGAAAPFLASAFLAGLLPFSLSVALYPDALLLAAAFGLLTTLSFTLLPLGRARAVPATALFRAQRGEGGGLPAWPYLAATGALLAVLGGLAILTAHDRYIAAVFLGAVAFAFVVLRLVAVGVAALARRSPQVRSPALRLAIGNIHRPGALTSSVVLSLGLGLALIVTLSLIDGNLRRELTGSLPERAPNFFFIDIQASEVADFRALLESQSPGGKVVEVPMLRGRIMAFNGEDIAKRSVPPESRWVLNGDRGITYARNVPENSKVTAGSWWPQDYNGEPLVSFAEKEAVNLGLKVGDTVTVNVLGRNITARIANLRTVEWESLAINFVMVFSPNTFKGAPHAWLATLIDAKADTAAEATILRAVTNRFPTVTSIRVKDALDIVDSIVSQLATAIRAAAAVALVASVLVLSGALAAGNRARTHDAVVLKTLGATRGLLIRAFTYEYLLLGLATALFSLLAGGVAAWFVVSRIMKLPSAFLPDVAVATLAVAILLTVGIGLAGTWRVLGQKAAQHLREL